MGKCAWPVSASLELLRTLRAKQWVMSNLWTCVFVSYISRNDIFWNIYYIYNYILTCVALKYGLLVGVQSCAFWTGKLSVRIVVWEQQQCQTEALGAVKLFKTTGRFSCLYPL